MPNLSSITDDNIQDREQQVVDREMTPQNKTMQLVEMAVNQNADLDKLERLMDMHDRWSKEEARKAYLVALSKFQSICPTIKKTKAGHNYKYADLGDIAEQIRPAMQQCGLTYRFEMDTRDAITVRCIVSHIDGHSEATELTGSPDTSGSKNTVQAMASTTSYLRRYALTGALGITTADEDMDGRLHTDTISEKQAEGIKKRLEATESDVGRFCRALGIQDVDSMPSTKYAQADRLLSQKEAANAKG